MQNAFRLGCFLRTSYLYTGVATRYKQFYFSLKSTDNSTSLLKGQNKFYFSLKSTNNSTSLLKVQTNSTSLLKVQNKFYFSLKSTEQILLLS